jgi:hypothetical protein
MDSKKSKEHIPTITQRLLWGTIFNPLPSNRKNPCENRPYLFVTNVGAGFIPARQGARPRILCFTPLLNFNYQQIVQSYKRHLQIQLYTSNYVSHKIINTKKTLLLLDKFGCHNSAKGKALS